MAVAAPVELIRGPEQAQALFHHPLRLKVLTELREAPASSTALARRLGSPRQLINYHVRALEKAGFLELAEARQARGLTERVMRVTALSFFLSPELLGSAGNPDSGTVRDRFSWAYLVNAAARVIRDLGILRARADAVQKKLPTFTLETEVRFASAADRNAFSEELARTVTALAVKYHNDQAPAGRLFRFVIGSYPAITKTDAEAETEASLGVPHEP